MIYGERNVCNGCRAYSWCGYRQIFDFNGCSEPYIFTFIQERKPFLRRFIDSGRRDGGRRVFAEFGGRIAAVKVFAKKENRYMENLYGDACRKYRLKVLSVKYYQDIEGKRRQSVRSKSRNKYEMGGLP